MIKFILNPKWRKRLLCLSATWFHYSVSFPGTGIVFAVPWKISITWAPLFPLPALSDRWLQNESCENVYRFKPSPFRAALGMKCIIQYVLQPPRPEGIWGMHWLRFRRDSERKQMCCTEEPWGGECVTHSKGSQKERTEVWNSSPGAQSLPHTVL